jgi:hypothetical protein
MFITELTVAIFPKKEMSVLGLQNPIYCSVYSCWYATIVTWAVTSNPFLGNGSVNTFPRERLRMQRGKRGVVYAIRAAQS